jgi:hypothetical protein
LVVVWSFVVTLGVLTFGTVDCGVDTSGVPTDGALTLGAVTVVEGTAPVSPDVPIEGTFSANPLAAARSNATRNTNEATAAIHFPRSIARTLVPR